jgi:hypothetical protein
LEFKENVPSIMWHDSVDKFATNGKSQIKNIFEESIIIADMKRANAKSPELLMLSKF